MKADKWKSVLVVLIGLIPAALYAQEMRSGLKDQTALAVTIYNENLALVKDQRRVTIESGELDLAIRDVSAQIRPETALLTGLDSNSKLELIEQNFDFDLLTPESLLKKYVGKTIRTVTVNPSNGNETIENAVVLATNQGIVLQFPFRIETQFPGRLIFDEVPGNLRDRPTLVLKLVNDNPEPQEIQLSYLTAGLSWRADYVASLNDDETRFDLNGWVTLTNHSGTTYPKALLQLVAGDVQQVQQVLPRMRSTAVLEMAAAPAAMDEEALFDYHLYTLQRPTTIANQQTKQVALMSAGDVPVSKQYLVDGHGQFFGGRSAGSIKQDVGVFIELENSEQSNLGLPLPAGIVRVYKNDSAGRIQFIGEDRIDHTAKDQEIQLKLGNAFDVTAERVQTSFRKVASQGQYNFSAEIGQRITLKNAKQEAVEVKIHEMIPGDWKINSESSPHSKISSTLVEWRVSVPAGATVEHEYETLVRY
ncbi:MAG: DUF4139 domain-containing protein [Arenicellales bacterium]